MLGLPAMGLGQRKWVCMAGRSVAVSAVGARFRIPDVVMHVALVRVPVIGVTGVTGRWLEGACVIADVPLFARCCCIQLPGAGWTEAAVDSKQARAASGRPGRRFRLR